MGRNTDGVGGNYARRQAQLWVLDYSLFITAFLCWIIAAWCCDWRLGLSVVGVFCLALIMKFKKE